MGSLTSGGAQDAEKKNLGKRVGSKVVSLLLFSKFPTICTHNKSKSFLMAFLGEG
jgi:hypothetical protein